MISSKYTTIKEYVINYEILSIILINIVGALANPKDMTNHSKRPSLDLKVVLHTLVYSIGTWR
jgi:hypothetical protein